MKMANVDFVGTGALKDRARLAEREVMEYARAQESYVFRLPRLSSLWRFGPLFTNGRPVSTFYHLGPFIWRQPISPLGLVTSTRRDAASRLY